MPLPRIRSFEFLSKSAEKSGSTDIRIHFEEGKPSTFTVATPDEPARWIGPGGADFVFGTPILFVSKLDQKTMRDSIEAMTRAIGGYWLRYYNSPDGPRRIMGDSSGKRAAGRDIVRVELTDRDSNERPDHASAVVQATLKDNRYFSILTATPSWFAAAFRKSELSYYFGPQILFLRTLDLACARDAISEMVQAKERWLCLYDTPRTTLPQVLSDFKSRNSA